MPSQRSRRLVRKRPVRNDCTTEHSLLALQPVEFPWEHDMVGLCIRGLTAPVLKGLDSQCRQIDQTAFAAFRLALAYSSGGFDQINLAPPEQAQFLIAQPAMD